MGGGSEQKKVKDFATQHGLANIVCLPYQPFDKLSASLSAADLHAVVMGDQFVGIVHPCKIYNILNIGTPFLYIGPTPSHVSEIASDISAKRNNGYRAYAAANGDVDTVVKSILEEAKRKSNDVEHSLPEIARLFSRQTIVPCMIKLLLSQAMTENQVFIPSERSSLMSAGR
jgi:hypothetical protein